VAEWVRNFNAASTERVYTFAGDNRIAQAGELYKFSLVDKNTKTGKPYPGGLRLWRIAVDVFKEDIRSRWEIPLDGPGVWLLYDGILTDGEDYLRQICNEVKRVDRSSSGQKKMIWRPADNRIGNHYWDCEVYSRAMAEICVSGNWKDLAFRAAPPVDRVPQPSRPEVTTPDGRAFCVSDR
jgi:phage terminase large subunit GpA-like protein